MDDDEQMDLYLNIVKTVPLKLKGSEKIGDIKALIHKKEAICTNDQVMLFNGNILTDAERLVDCGIQSNSTLHLIVKNPIAMKIFVKITSSQRIITLEATAWDTVHKIKSVIQAKEGFMSDAFTLVYDGHLLQDDSTLASHDIRRNSTIHLVFCQSEVLSVFVKSPNAEIVKLSVKVTFTVGDVKAIVGGKIRVSASRWELFWSRKQLESSKTLAFYDIKDGSCLELIPNPMQIFVKTWMGKTLILDVNESNTVHSIKDKVFQRLKIPIDLQSIVYAGRRLDETCDLASYGIQNNSTLHMVLAPSSRLRKVLLTDIGIYSTDAIDILLLKSVLQEKFNYPVTEVLFDGKTLEDGKTLSYYGIEKDEKVVVVF